MMFCCLFRVCAVICLYGFKTRTFIILLTDYKVLPGFVFVPIVLCKLLHVFYYCLNFKTIQFWIWYHTLFLAANSGELIILVLAPGFQRSRWVKVVFNGAVEWKWSSVRGGAMWLIAGHFLTHGMLQISK